MLPVTKLHLQNRNGKSLVDLEEMQTSVCKSQKLL